MSDLYVSNRSQASVYHDELIARLSDLFTLNDLIGSDPNDTQSFYLQFKNHIQEFVEKESAAGQEEMLASDNSHLLLLKRTALVDVVVKRAFHLALDFYNKIQNTNLKSNDLPVAIVARSGYGREELSFGSDVSIKFVFRESDGVENLDAAIQVIKDFEYLFVYQDIFRTVARSGNSILDTDDQELDDNNMSSLFSLLEHRFVTGNKTVYREFASSIKTTCIFHKDKLISYCDRYKNLYGIHNTVFKQEPHLREELNRVYWALSLARLRHSIPKNNLFEILEEMHNRKLISTPAFKKSQVALNFLARTRMALHCHQKGAQRDLLSYEVREHVAKAMGYSVKEFFNKYFYTSVLPLKRFSRGIFWESLSSDSKKVQTLSADFAVNAERQIIFTQGRNDFTWNTLGEMLELFTWVSRRNLYFSYPVARAIEENVDRMAPLFQMANHGTELQPYFHSILRGKHFAQAIRYLHEFGLLDQLFIPEYKNLSGMLQDIYVHLFPTDTHLMHAMDALNGLEIDPEKQPFLFDLYQSLRDKSTIRLAVMLHDIGKGLKREGENEELVGGRAIPGILGRLGYGRNPKLIRDVAFLVEKHLMMRDLMMLDPDEDDTYEMIWDLVEKDVERLKMLILLTYADRAATKMNMSQSQIDQLKYFYQNTLHHKKRESVSWPVKNEFLRMIRLPRDMQSQLEIYNEFKKSRDKFSVELFFRADHPSELVLCTCDQGGLLFKVATVLAFNHLSITDARIHTLGDNVFDVFQVAEIGQKPIDFSNFFLVQKKIKEELRKVFVGNIEVSELYKGRPLSTTHMEERAGPLKAKVSIIGRAVKLECSDMLGITMLQTKFFSKLNMQIQRAVINSQYGTASNIYYLRPEDVREIMNDEEGFKNTLRDALEPLTRNQPIFPDSPAEVA
ncbi:MAG: hypothetical protein G3M70_07855 [Candidatus Nitronauta litoralis]|uniref:ACT domain-containing protein n=1 Tax=Candidatus Nitronauta litoralis TaxID=2705533 RepID=A0A7T0BVP8_9BACT|nr:MAG: hypothetical protein G3M70_07855 [Candidatus Nitronauta litoralis]